MVDTDKLSYEISTEGKRDLKSQDNFEIGRKLEDSFCLLSRLTLRLHASGQYGPGGKTDRQADGR